jgi:hypothetical protein
MTSFEFYSLFISILAVVAYAVALIRTRILSKKQIELEQVTADLSQKHLQQIREAELEKTKAHIDLELINNGPNNQYLYIKNTGQSEAKNVKIKLLGENFPFFEREFTERIPIKILKSGKQVGLWFSDEIKPIYSYDFEVSWVNPDGETKFDKHTIHLD